MHKGNKTVSLVLGSGELQENGYQISSISGCSMGALIGGIFAAGKLEEFEHWISSILLGQFTDHPGANSTIADYRPTSRPIS